ncbi:MAG: hypothetical protein IPM39_19740 [Chloroflexi bacterium]|nr:hypothetical protein [Chloroflexota bacterium]
MKGDFSRNTFNPENPYHSVRLQQGRILLDADWNEQADLLNLRHAAAMRHLIGAHGGLGDSFRIALAESDGADEAAEGQRPLPDLLVHPGEYYVGGYLSQLNGDAPIPLAQQPAQPDWQAHLAETLGEHNAAIVYLTVWEQHLTALEEPALAEPALGGADTTTRSQLVWQIRLLPLAETPAEDAALESLPDWSALTQRDRPTLTVKRGYASENRLYRLEIHSVEGDDVTWKWSRHNGASAYRLTNLEPDASMKNLRATVGRAWMGSVNLTREMALELSCAAWELNGRSGIPARLLSTPDSGPQPALDLQLFSPIAPADWPLLEAGATLRQWDHRVKEGNGMLPLKPGALTELEQGMMVTFAENGRYQPGDYWQIPVRIGDAVGETVQVPWQGPWRVYAPLALLYEADGWRIRDGRRVYENPAALFARLARLQTALAATGQALDDLRRKTEEEHETQEEAITLLQGQLADLSAQLNEVAGRPSSRDSRAYRSQTALDMGEVVSHSSTSDDAIVRATRAQSPIGVVALRPDGLGPDQYEVVLSGPALCRVHGAVRPGDLLAMSEKAGHLAPASRWTIWFQPERIFARAIDMTTTSESGLIYVYVLPSTRRRG